jgi:hypothetical protein
VVDSYFQKQMAQEALRHVDGIDQISNELEVCWGRPAAVPIAHAAQASSL